MKLNSVSFQSLFNKFLCKSQILQNGKGVRKNVYHGSEKCECISFCIDYILVVLAKKGDAPILFIFLTEIILNFLYDVTGMVQIECQGWNEYFFTSDVVKWKHFPHYCPFVRGIHRPLVILRKGPVICVACVMMIRPEQKFFPYVLELNNHMSRLPCGNKKLAGSTWFAVPGWPKYNRISQYVYSCSPWFANKTTSIWETDAWIHCSGCPFSNVVFKDVVKLEF